MTDDRPGSSDPSAATGPRLTRRSGPPGASAAAPGRAARASRLRLVVLQAVVFSLFATLAARLYYLQVVGGEEYQGQAASQSVREVVVQPQRGLIVDDEGRPLVANRTSWVVSADTSVLGSMSHHQRTSVLRRTAGVLHTSVLAMTRRMTLCGTEDAVVGVCWNGSPYQPVPVAQDVDQGVALRILEQPEDFPGIVVDQQSIRS